MAFLALYTAPKPFSDPHIAMIQKNAVRSWRQLGDDVDVLVIGDETGAAAAVRETGGTFVSQVERNELGTPLVSSIFHKARENSEAAFLAYLNADIIVLPDFIDAVRGVAKQARNFLVVGQRWDLDIREELDFDIGWDTQLREDVHVRGQIHPPAGSDYFIFPRTLFKDIPDFAIGRAGWDNWMIFNALDNGWPVIDATQSIMVIHQNHDYSHLPGGKPHYDLEETDQNISLGGGANKMYMLLDADHELVNGEIRQARPTLARLLRAAERKVIPADDRRDGLRWSLARRFRRWRRKLVREQIPE